MVFLYTFPAEIKSFREHNPSVTVYEDVAFIARPQYHYQRRWLQIIRCFLVFDPAFLYGKAIADKIAKGLVFEWNLDQVKK